MTGETPLQNARHLRAQFISSVVSSARRLREVRSKGTHHQAIASIVGGGLCLIWDKEKDHYRFSAPFDERVCWATPAIIQRWNKKAEMNSRVRMMSLEDALKDHLISAATFLVDIEARIELFEAQEISG